MIFTELRFFAFFALVFGVHWGMASNRGRKIWLLAASFAFYAAWDWRFLSLIVVSILVDYGVGLALASTTVPSRRRFLLGVSLVVNLGLLGYFKYAGFFVEGAQQLLEAVGLPASRASLDIVLPVGISFYTFQTLSYSIDVFRRRLEPSRNLLDVALFVAFFPQLVAGPIVRAAHFLPQLARRSRWSDVTVRSHLVFLLVGFFKKACIADNLAPTVDAYFASPLGWDTQAAWLAVLLFGIQIYCDFSGYSDIAIATAGLLGFDLGANFRHPYLAASPREFWQRWHISLSTWLRDYLYVPLGGNRGSTLATYRNLLLTMVLGGLWHGAAWRFLFWGFVHGLALAVHRMWWQRSARVGMPRMPGWLGVLVTQLVVAFGWIFFRAPDWSTAWTTVGSLVGRVSEGAESFDPRWWLLIAVCVLAHWMASRLEGQALASRVSPPLFALGYGVAVGLVLLFVQVDVQPFIYFQF